MSKLAVSVTLDADNLTWLRGRAGARGGKSVSAVLDEIVTAARHAKAGPSRSVAGTIDIAGDDANLAGADKAVRAAFDASLQRPVAVREERPRYSSGKKSRA
jgi:hypothetical protein